MSGQESEWKSTGLTLIDPEWCEHDGEQYCGTLPKNRRCDSCSNKPRTGGK